MPNASRKTDAHTCPSQEPGPTPHEGGPINSPCSGDVEVENQPASRGSKEATGDFATCKAGGPDFIAQGAETVLINNMYATWVGCKTEHAGVITGHTADVEYGGPLVTFRTIKKRDGSASANERQGDSLGDASRDGAGTKDDQSKEAEADKPTDTWIKTLRIIAKPYSGYIAGLPRPMPQLNSFLYAIEFSPSAGSKTVKTGVVSGSEIRVDLLTRALFI